MPTGLGVDFKQLSQKIKPEQWKQFQRLTKNLDTYEKRVREAVRNLDLKSQQARKASEARLKEVSDQIRKTRSDVERRVKGLLEEEAKKLNVRLREIYSYLVKVAQKEQAAQSGTHKASGRKSKQASKASPRKPATKKAGSKNSSSKKTAMAATEPGVDVLEQPTPKTPIH